MTKYRAQVLSEDGERWVDGGLFGDKDLAIDDAHRLYVQYRAEVRVIEEDDPFEEDS